MEKEILRRYQVDQYTPAEKAIYDAIQEVEKMGASHALTDIVLMLIEAKESLHDFIDELNGVQIIP